MRVFQTGFKSSVSNAKFTFVYEKQSRVIITSRHSFSKSIWCIISSQQESLKECRESVKRNVRNTRNWQNWHVYEHTPRKAETSFLGCLSRIMTSNSKALYKNVANSSQLVALLMSVELQWE